jgi:predicted TIM-barrel fold metal-dependent hydrolase
MELNHGLISADSHATFDRDDFTSRMSAAKWGDKVPQVVEVEIGGKPVHRWSVYGIPSRDDVSNCPAVMGEPFPTYPQRWEDVPRSAYDPAERLKALDHDRVDAEVLFPNHPGGSFDQFADPEFELDAIRAYNDTLSAWARISDRYLPLALLPYLSGPESAAQEIARAAQDGHRGINLVGQMPESLPHLTDPHWDPIWDVCQELDIPVHFHGSAMVKAGASVRKWDGYSMRQAHTAMTSTSAVTPAQIIPQLIFSGVTERFPNMKCVFAEAGIGGLNYVLAACDHEWESRHLWTEGISGRPSETVHRQMYVNFWFEAEGIKLRHEIGIDNIMWESDFPHVASFYPKSWESVERVLAGVSDDDRRKLLYENAVRVYRIEVSVPVATS